MESVALERRQAAAVCIYSPQSSGEDRRWGVMVAFDDMATLLINGQTAQETEHALHVTLGPPQEQIDQEFIGVVQCSPEQLVEWANSVHHEQSTAPFNEQWASECSAAFITHANDVSSSMDELAPSSPIMERLFMGYFNESANDLKEKTSHDTWQRRAKVYVLHSAPVTIANSFNRLFQNNGSRRKCWVVIEFTPGKAYTFDRTSRRGQLVVCVASGWPEQQQLKTNAAGEIECSPKDLFKLARIMLAEDPGSVRVPKHNDHRWANAFVDELMSEFSPKAKFGVTPEVDVDRFEESDAIERPAQVYIYKTDPEESTNGWRQFATGLHWGVIVAFDDGRTLTFNAFTENRVLFGGKLAVHVREGEPERRKVRERRQIGECQCSPMTAVALAKNVKDARPRYHFVTNNCQDWANRFSSQLCDVAGFRLMTTTAKVVIPLAVTTLVAPLEVPLILAAAASASLTYGMVMAFKGLQVVNRRKRARNNN